MKRIKTLFISTAVISAFAISRPSSAQTSHGADPVSFKASYSQAIVRLKKLYSRVVASGTITRNEPGNPSAAASPALCQINVMDGLFRATIVHQKPDASGRLSPNNRFVYCVGPDLGFVATTGRSENGRYILTQISNGYENRVEEGTDGVLTDFRDASGKYLFAAFLVNAWDQPDFSDVSSYEVVSLQSVSQDGEARLRLNYRWKPSNPGAPGCSGEIDLLPDRGWVARRHLFKGKARLLGAGAPAKRVQDYTILQEVEYGDDFEGVAVPTRVRHRLDNEESVCDFESVKFGVARGRKDRQCGQCGLHAAFCPPRVPVGHALA